MNDQPEERPPLCETFPFRFPWSWITEQRPHLLSDPLWNLSLQISMVMNHWAKTTSLVRPFVKPFPSDFHGHESLSKDHLSCQTLCETFPFRFPWSWITEQRPPLLSDPLWNLSLQISMVMNHWKYHLSFKTLCEPFPSDFHGHELITEQRPPFF